MWQFHVAEEQDNGDDDDGGSELYNNDFSRSVFNLVAPWGRHAPIVL